MRNWIAKKDDIVVGKFRQHKKPEIEGDVIVEEIEDLSDYNVDEWYFDE